MGKPAWLHSAQQSREGHLFLYTLFITVILRAVLATWLPITGDEAYFIVWGKHFDYGYYDHTPLVGWLLGLLLQISDHPLWLRLPAILVTVFIALGIYHLLKERNDKVAALVAATFLVVPVHFIGVLITTDTLLILFSFVSSVYFYRAIEQQRHRDYLWCGLYLGLAFFSKYFAVLLGISYGLYILFFERNRRAWTGLALVVLMVLPFVITNILWNYNHCWNNILFNLYNRTAVPDGFINNMFKYVLLLLYLFTPVWLYDLYKNREKREPATANTFNRLYLFLFAVPMLMFAVLAFRKEIGLHWVLSFFPFAFLVLLAMLPQQQIRRLYKVMIGFSVIHVLLMLSLFILPPQTFGFKKEAVQNIVIGKYPQEVFSSLQPYQDEYQFGTISYGMSSIASYYTRQHFLVFALGSFHARQDDSITDFRKLDGKNILIFKRTSQHLQELDRYFNSVEIKTINVHGADFYLFLGHGFNYTRYYEEVLVQANKQFYAIPDWLPVGQCEFKQKYGF